MIKTFHDAEQLNSFAAEKFVEIADASIRSGGIFTVALSGGSTPKSLFQLLSSDEYKNKVDWSKVFFFFGDERNVALDDKDSNFLMADENLFAPLQIPDANIFRWNTEAEDAQLIAEDYETAILVFFSLSDEELFPRFDLIFLGMGADGHTASLFPQTQALKETKRNAVANRIEKLDTTRLTLTFPAINNAANLIFLVKGADKAETLREVLQGEFQPEKYPAQAVKLNDGKLLWLIEKKAAEFLESV
jgi:6-phosphogluconolactonase